MPAGTELSFDYVNSFHALIGGLVYINSAAATAASPPAALADQGTPPPARTVLAAASSPRRHFQILANPARHQEFDGSDSLRGVRSAEVVSGVGDVFVMKMRFPHLGDYEMNNHVVEYEQDRRIGWEPEAGRGHLDAAPDSPDPARWGHWWSYQLTPDGPDVTVVTEIYDCSRAPEEEGEGRF